MKVSFSFCIIFFIQLTILIHSHSIRLFSNFNSSKVSDKSKPQLKQNDHLTLPIILTNPGQYKSNKPLFQNYKIQRYQLYDSNYRADTGKISKLDEQLVFNMEPPTGVFQQNGKIIIQNYRLLQIRQLKLTLVNPSQKFRFCIDQIHIDSEQITRQEKRPLPFCMNSTTKYPFFFSLYITQHKPMILKATVYFIITIYDQNQVVDWKIWPKQIIVKILHNHLRIIPLQIRNCQRDNSIVMIRNPQKWDLSLVIIYKRKLYEITGEPIQGNIVIPALKSYKFIIDGKDSKMTIYTKSSNPQVIYPVLYVPIYCLQDLIIDYFNIGILSEDRSIIQFPITLSSYSNTTIKILQISLKSNTQTVQLLALRENFNVQLIPPNSRHVIVCRIIIHSSKTLLNRANFEVSVKYMSEQTKSLEVNSQQIQMQVRQSRTQFGYSQMRSPITIGDNKRFIDISRLKENNSNHNEVSQNGFPLRNNLNIPINLIRVIYDQSKFKLLWLQDRRDYIFPNHQRQQFSFQYIGPRNLHISPTKYLALLQFNGNLFIPLQIVVFDKTLQCIYNEVTTKCQNLQTIDFGYFNQAINENQNKQAYHEMQDEQDISNFTGKSKLITIRNYNPEVVDINLGIQQDTISKYGFNISVELFGPFPNYEVLIKKQKNIFDIKLKSNHFIVVGITLSPLHNATSGSVPFKIFTNQQKITKPIKFKVQNGTIALIPQITRFHSSFSKTIEYINLVSTYTQPYRIKSINTNMSNVMVYCNNYSEIYQNQWIGMAVIYEPFNGQFNITNQCCGAAFLKKILPQIIKPSYVQTVQITLKTTTELITNASVVIDKSAAALIQSPSTLFYNNREKYRKDAIRIDINLIQQKNNEYEYSIQVKNQFDLNLKANIYMFEQTLIERLEEYTQYKKMMHSKVSAYFCFKNQVKIKHGFTPSLLKTLFRLQSLPVEITVQPLDNSTIYLNSPAYPREEVLQISQVSEYFFKIIQSGSRMCYRMEIQTYMKNLIQTGIINYMSEHFRYQTLVSFMNKQFQQLQKSPYSADDISNIGSSNGLKYHLQYDEFYMTNYIDQNNYCKGQKHQKRMTALFRYCQHVNIKTSFTAVTQQKTVIKMQECKQDRQRCRRQGKKTKKVYGKEKNKYFLLAPQKRTTISYKIVPYDPKNIPVGVQHSALSNSKAGRISQFSNWSSGIQLNPLPSSRFYLVLVNNYTTFQLYHKTIQITKPKIRIKNVLIEDHAIQINEFQLHYFKQLQNHKERHQVLPIFIGEEETQQMYVKIGSTQKQAFLSSQFLNSQKTSVANNLKQIEPIYSIQMESRLFVQGQRSFQIANDGQADVTYTHIGFQNIQKACSYQGFTLVADACPLNNQLSPSINVQSFKIHPKENYIIKIRYNMSLDKIVKYSQQPIYVYFYNSHNYHIKMLIYIKLSPKLIKMNQTSVTFTNQKVFVKFWNIALSLFAFVFICSVIFMFKQQESNDKKKKKSYSINSKVHAKSDKNQHNFYKQNKKFKSKQESLYEWAAAKSQEEGLYKILQPSSYAFTIGTLITQKQTSLHPVVTVTQQILASIKQQQKKYNKLTAYFNESEESQIIAKHQHEIQNNISLNLNLDDLGDNQNQNDQKKNDSISEDSSFDFGVHRNQQDKNQQDELQEGEISNSNSDFSVAEESDLPDGEEVQITQQILNDSDEGFGFGFQSGAKVPKKEAQHKKQEPIKEENKSYYNVFFAQNPLKKGTNPSPFAWMNKGQDKKRSRLNW